MKAQTKEYIKEDLASLKRVMIWIVSIFIVVQIFSHYPLVFIEFIGVMIWIAVSTAMANKADYNKRQK